MGIQTEIVFSRGSPEKPLDLEDLAGILFSISTDNFDYKNLRVREIPLNISRREVTITFVDTLGRYAGCEFNDKGWRAEFYARYYNSEKKLIWEDLLGFSRALKNQVGCDFR